MKSAELQKEFPAAEQSGTIAAFAAAHGCEVKLPYTLMSLELTVAEYLLCFPEAHNTAPDLIRTKLEKELDFETKVTHNYQRCKTHSIL